MGGSRGRLVSASDKEHCVQIIQEAIRNGATLKSCCAELEISVRTYQRWKSGKHFDKRKGALKSVPRKLTNAERDEVISVACSDEFKDSNPYDIYITLLERGSYLASIKTFYRILKERNLLHNRTNKRSGTKQRKPPELVATGPNQVWTWDITWLPSYTKGIFYYAYTVIDIWDKSIVGWAIHDEESDHHARDLFAQILCEQGYPKVRIHSDNGNPMKGMTLLALLYDLGCKNSYSRPRVSNDNPFIESFFGTLKTSYKYPGKFKSRQQARSWFAEFIHWYNTSHRHSGLQYFTPQQMRSGEYKELISVRNKTLDLARKNNPCRWSGKQKAWTTEHTVYLNPSAATKEKLSHAA